ncbi:unnamed protein product [Cladocopium goreaui]|uniref:Serine-threonine kinase receptor-associated protein n=1 Tax=Cladocopium goreaui TaxID=2562237 RepID=A0A9P1CPG8_9DINO|nr:unnamed protein product [Cladocopium goreaui]
MSESLRYQKQSAFAEDEKEFLKLAKKLRDILKLEEKVKAGESLAQNQLEKVNSKETLLKEVTALAGKLPGDSDVLEKTQDITALLPATAVQGIERRRKQELERRQSREKKQEEERRAPVFMCRHDRPILGVCVSADGRYLFTCSKDGYLICWSLEEKLLKALYTFAGHTGAVFTLDVTSAPPLLISGSADGQVNFWEGDPARLKPLTVTSPKKTLEHGGRVRDQLDGVLPVLLKSWGFELGKHFLQRSIESSTPAMIAVWNASPAGEAEKLLEIKDLPGKANDLQWGGGGKLKLFSAHDNGYVGVWLAEAPGSLMKTIKLHNAAISSLTLSSDATTLVTASHDKTSKAVDVSQPATETLATFELNRPLNAVAVSKDFQPQKTGTVVLAGGKDARDVTRAKDMQEDEFEAKVIDSASGKILAAGTGHFGPVHGLLSLPRIGTAGAFATVSEDGCLKVHGLDGSLLHSDTLSPAEQRNACNACTASLRDYALCLVTACRERLGRLAQREMSYCCPRNI